MVVTQLNYYNVLNCWLNITEPLPNVKSTLSVAFFIFYKCAIQKDVTFHQWPPVWSNRVRTVLQVLEF